MSVNFNHRGTMATSPRVGGEPIPPELLGELHGFAGDLSDHAALRDALLADGFVLLRGAIPRAVADAAAAEVFGRLVDEGEVLSAAGRQVTGSSHRRSKHPDLGVFWKDVCEGMELRAAVCGPALREAVSTLYGEPARPFDLLCETTITLCMCGTTGVTCDLGCRPSADASEDRHGPSLRLSLLRDPPTRSADSQRVGRAVHRAGRRGAPAAR